MPALAQADSPLAWTVNRAQATDHLATSSSESRDAAPGYQYVVLDVSVRNPDTQPQVLSEGALIAMDESKVQTFDRPETLLSDDYLSLQVLAPSEQVHGKIAFEVPQSLAGVLFWSPGNGGKRILLTLTSPTLPPRTLANANADGDARTPTHGIEPARFEAPRIGPRRVEPASTAPAVAKQDTPPARPVSKAAPKAGLPSRRFSPASLRTHVPTRELATIVLPTSRRDRKPVLPTTSGTTTAPAADPEQSRKLACAGLVSRDDPAEKEGSLGFFAESCREYALPAHWSPQPAPRKSLRERASALLARMVVAPRVVRISDCSASNSRADLLVCGDPELSTMDHTLSQAVARASDQVDDPAALQRDQALWRGRVRDACATTDCLAQAYGRRIGQLDALASMRP
jgi:hypothetical protein